MNFLIVSSYYAPASVYGGPVPAIQQLCRGLIVAGHKASVYTTNANGNDDLNVPLQVALDVDGLPVTYFPRWWFGRKRKPFNLFLSPALGRALRRLQPGDFDLMIIMSLWGDPGRMAAKAAMRVHLPYICYTYGGLEPWAFNHKQLKKEIYFKLIERNILKEAAGIVVSNDAENKKLRSLGIQTMIRKIPSESMINGIVLDQPLSKNRLQYFLPCLKDNKYILFLSRLHPKKGLDLLLPAFARIASDFPDWSLVIAGPGEKNYRGSLEQQASKLGVNRRILFTGMVTGEHKATLLSHADIFVLPSYSEGFPVVVAEALAYGRPLILTNTCYVPEVAQWGAGIEIPPEREPLAKALRSLMADEAKRRQCATNALKLSQQHFTWDAVAQQSLAFFQEVTQCHSSN